MNRAIPTLVAGAFVFAYVVHQHEELPALVEHIDDAVEQLTVTGTSTTSPTFAAATMSGGVSLSGTSTSSAGMLDVIRPAPALLRGALVEPMGPPSWPAGFRLQPESARYPQSRRVVSRTTGDY